MGPGVIVVEVLSKTGRPYLLGGRFWPPAWTEAAVDEDLLAALRTDPHVMLRVFSTQEQAARVLGHAKRELDASTEDKARADARHRKAVESYESAKALAEAAGPVPAVPTPTPWRDSLRAAGVLPSEPAPLHAPAPPSKDARGPSRR